MPLFEGKSITEVVTAKDIKQFTGIKANDFQFKEETNPETELEALLNIWITRIGSHVSTRVKRTFLETDDEYDAIIDIVVRTVAKLVAVAYQQRTSPIVQVGEFALSILNTYDVVKDLKKEVRPFKDKKVIVFSSADEYNES